MLKAKRGISLQLNEKKLYIFSVLEVGDGPEAFSHQFVMQYLKFTLYLYKLKLFRFVQNFKILWNQCEKLICIIHQ